MILDELEKPIGQSDQEAGAGAHANAAPGVKASSASEDLPQAASSVLNGNGGDHSRGSRRLSGPKWAGSSSDAEGWAPDR